MKGRGPRIAIIAVLLLGLIIFGGVYFAWTTAIAIFQPVSAAESGKTVPIVIQNGETTAQIADDLQAKGLIRNAVAFRIWARIKGLDKSLQAGEYNLNTSMTISDIIDDLLNAQPDELVVSFPPGFRIEQIAKRISTAGLTKFNVQDFLRYTKHPNQFPDAGKYPILKSIPPGDSMEGLLFPDTYLVPVDATTRDVLNMLLTAFNKEVQQYHLDTQAKAHHLSEYQMVILASILEREVIFNADLPGVASVYWNRVNVAGNESAGFLDADPTVQYARDAQSGTKVYWAPLNDQAKNIVPDSPWNTYTHKYWPPTPICSPQLADLEAAAAPPRTPYFYFLSKKDGHIIFAKTYAEFQQDEQQYLQQ